MKTFFMLVCLLFLAGCSSSVCEMEEISQAELSSSDWTCEAQNASGACSMYRFVGTTPERVACSDNDCPTGDCAERSICVEWEVSICTKYNKGCYCTDESGCHN